MLGSLFIPEVKIALQVESSKNPYFELSGSRNINGLRFLNARKRGVFRTLQVFEQTDGKMGMLMITADLAEGYLAEPEQAAQVLARSA